jgi:hypothetical protein
MMKPNIRYIVTKGNATFRVGDHVRLCEDGAILCNEAGGSIDSGEVEKATKGWEIKEDDGWLDVERKRLESALNALNKTSPA